MARAFQQVLDPSNLTVIVNVGDDEEVYGVRVSADLDTVSYTLAGIEGPQGWGVADDTFTVMDNLSRLGVDTAFRLGDRDLAVCLRRTGDLDAGMSLSESTAGLTTALGVACRVLPATNGRLRTRVEVSGGDWLDFQDYFVLRGHRDPVEAVGFDGAASAEPAPGVLETIDSADLVIIAPSNPPLSIWPILAVSEIKRTLAAHPKVLAVSPLFGGKALKGPADQVMAGLGLPAGNAGVLAAYEGLLSDLVIDQGDHADQAELDSEDVGVHVMDTRLTGADQGVGFARDVLDVMSTMRGPR